MKLILKRTVFAQDYTCGRLYVDSVYFCDTLERTDRATEWGGTKIMGETAIPLGVYKVKLTYSTAFKKYLPEVLDVPNFTGVRIHGGNTWNDSKGCILVGQQATQSTLTNSTYYKEKLIDLIKGEKEVTLQITR